MPFGSFCLCSAYAHEPGLVPGGRRGGRGRPARGPVSQQRICIARQDGRARKRARRVHGLMARTTYTAAEAAQRLGISLDTLRRWDRDGRIQVERDARNRRVVPAAEVERLRAADAHGISARNRFVGTVTEVKTDGLM